MRGGADAEYVMILLGIVIVLAALFLGILASRLLIVRPGDEQSEE